MKVPEVETSVTPQVPNVEEAQAPRPIAAAYGAQVNEAQAGIGKAAQDIGSVLAQHAEKQMAWDAQIQGYQALEAYKTTLQNNETASGTKTVLNSMGKKIEMPLGYLDRKGIFASGRDFPGNGVVTDFDKDSFKARNDIMKNLPLAARQHFVRTADAYTEGYRQKYIKYEAAQKEGYDVSVFNNTIKGKVQDAQSAMDPKSLKTVIDGAPGVEGLMTTNEKLGAYRQEPPETTLINGKKHMLDAVTASSMSVLRNTGDLEKAQGQVTAFADRLDPGDSAKLSETLERTKKALTINQDFAVKTAIDKNDLDFVQRAADPDPTKRPTEEEAYKAYMLGTGKDPRGISKSVYDAWKEGGKAEPITQEEKDQKLVDLSDAHAKLVKNDNTLDTNARFEDVANYRAKLMDAFNHKAISNATYLKSLQVTNKIYDKGLDGEVNKAYKTGNSVQTFLKNAVGYMFGQKLQTDPQVIDAKAYLGKALMERMNEGGIPEGQESAVAQELLHEYIKSHDSSVLGAKAVPNNTASKKDGVQAIHTNIVDSFSDRKISGPSAEPVPPAFDPKTEKLQQNPVTKAYRVVKK